MVAMPLPVNPRTPWPPKFMEATTSRLAVAKAWYSGDEGKLSALYASSAQTQPRIAFWSRKPPAQGNRDRQRLHLPAASDVASTSADLLFGEEPVFTIPEAHAETKDAKAVATEARLLELLDQNGAASVLVQAAELGAALGGVYLRPAWDRAVAPYPLLTSVNADAAVPEFRYGVLTAVTFWRCLEMDTDTKGAVYRHLERHEAGRVLHGLYVGTSGELGKMVPLSDHPATAALIGGDSVTLTEGSNVGVVTLPAGIDGLLVRYVPNALPNRDDLSSSIGRPDTRGVEDLMDALDETWSSWMRDIRLGKGRLVVPQSFLERTTRGGGAAFDLDREVFAGLEMPPSTTETITVAQFEIRMEQHAGTAAALFESIVSNSGYSPQTFGLMGTGAAQTATEVKSRDDRTEVTTSKKQRHWKAAVQDVTYMLLVIDREIFGNSGVEPMRPAMAFCDREDDDPVAVATTANLLKQAQAASTETLVRMTQPDLEPDAVTAEVARILAENAVMVGDPTGIGANAGAGNG